MKKITNKNSRQSRLNAQRGNMMLNAIIALIISAIVTTAGYLGFKYVEDAKVDNEISEIASLRASTILLAQGRGTDFTGIDLATLAGLNFFPNARVSGTGASTVVLNQWKGVITVAPTTTISTNDSITFSYSGVPTYACKSLATPLANVAVAISIGGTVVKANGGVLNLTNAIAQCNAGADNATMAYTLSR
jgi:PilS N terminal